MSSRAALLLLLMGVLALDLVGIGWALPHTVAPQPDDIAKPALESMRQGFVGESKYPKVHQLTLAAAYAPYLGWLWITGELDLKSLRGGATQGGAGDAVGAADADGRPSPGSAAVRDPGAVLTTLLRIARGVSVALHIGCVALIYFIARRLAGPADASAQLGESRAGVLGSAGVPLAAAALFGFSPVLALFARGTWVDVPMLFWFAATLWAALLALEEPSRRRLVGCALLAVLAVCTKEQIAFALLPVGLAVGWRALFPTANNGTASMRRRDSLRALLLASVAGLLLYALLNDLLWAPQLWTERLAWWGAEMERYRQITGGRQSAVELLGGFAEGYVFGCGPALAVLSVFAAASLALLPTRRGVALFALLLLYPLLLGAWLGFTQPRYAFPMVLLGALLVAQQSQVALAALSAQTHRRARTALVGLLVMAVAAQAAHGAQVAWALLDEPRAQAGAWLDARLPDGTRVEVYQDDEELPGLRALGLLPAPARELTTEGFVARRPVAVVATNADHWRFAPAERLYLDCLRNGAPGDAAPGVGRSGQAPPYEVANFGPAAGGRSPWLVDASSRTRLWPDVTVLVRRDESAPLPVKR
ncbi:MAG: hypothetical protein ACT4PU_11125 [Planctomycetota bacterium]